MKLVYGLKKICYCDVDLWARTQGLAFAMFLIQCCILELHKLH